MSSLLRRVLIWRAAVWRDCWVAKGPPVTMRFPFAIYLMAASVTCRGEIVANFLIRALDKISSFTQLFFVISRCARSTKRLGLGGLVPATAKKVQVGGFWGVEGVCLLELAGSFLLEGGGEVTLLQGINSLGHDELRVEVKCIAERMLGGLSYCSDFGTVFIQF